MFESLYIGTIIRHFHKNIEFKKANWIGLICGMIRIWGGGGARPLILFLINWTHIFGFISEVICPNAIKPWSVCIFPRRNIEKQLSYFNAIKNLSIPCQNVTKAVFHRLSGYTITTKVKNNGCQMDEITAITAASVMTLYERFLVIIWQWTVDLFLIKIIWTTS